MPNYKIYYQSPIGWLEIIAIDKNIIAINFVKQKKAAVRVNSLLKKCCQQLTEYFQGRRQKFNINFQIQGTNFQQKVWQNLLRVPYSSIMAYQDLATAIGQFKAGRAVGQAVNKNKLPIIIPSHQVIGSNGQLIGYAGGLWRKK